jgi:hypothetical protein
MHTLPLEFIHPLDIRPGRLIQLSDARNEHICRQFVSLLELGIFSAGHRHLDLPFPGLVVPPRLLDGRVEPDVRVQTVLPRNAGEIVQNFLLARVLACPSRPLFKGVAVQGTPDCEANYYQSSDIGTSCGVPSQAQPGYLLSFQVPPTELPFSRMTKLRWLRRRRSMAMHIPAVRYQQHNTIRIKDSQTKATNPKSPPQ